MRRCAAPFLLAAVLARPAVAAPVAEEAVATALVVSVDVSGCVDDARFRLQRAGIAEAPEDPSVLQAALGDPGGISLERAPSQPPSWPAANPAPSPAGTPS